MHDAGLKLLTQPATGRARCLCDIEINNKNLADHVAAHLEMRWSPQTSPYADPEKAARRLMEHARAFEPIPDGRIYIEEN
jgi:hypothetical protein